MYIVNDYQVKFQIIVNFQANRRGRDLRHFEEEEDILLSKQVKLRLNKYNYKDFQ